MKHLKILFATICWFVTASSYAQTIKFPENIGKDCDSQTYLNCINYIKQNRLANGEVLKDYSTRFYPINRNGDIFVISTTKSHTEKTRMYSDNGFFDPVLGWSNTATLVKNVDKQSTYVIFVSKQGEILQSIGGFNSMLDIKVVDDKRVLLLNGYYEKENKKITRFYKEIACFNLDGTEQWRANPQMFFQDYATTYNNIYIVGSEEESQYKVLSLKDGSVVFDKEAPAPNNRQSRFTNVVLSMNGVVITREYKYGKETVTETYPYVSNDKSYKEGLVFKQYDKNKANDQVTIGTRYLNGDGFTKDYKKAVEWYEKAANQNNSRGQYCLGYCYQNGLGVAQDLAKAASLYEKSTSQGDKDAMAALSKMYLNGNGVSKDLSKALHWQEILAFDGDKEARKTVMRNQSAQYEKADISASEVRSKALDSHKQKEYEWAEFCMKRAIELGDGDARLDYGLWLANGDGVQKDYSKAEEYLTPFAESGLKEASSVLGMIYQNLNDKKKEMYWVEKAAIDGDVASQVRLAEAYLKGEGVKKNKKRALFLYETAAENGDEEAIKELVYGYLTGKLAKKDESTSFMWFNKLGVQDQLEVAEEIESNPKIKCSLGTLVNMYEEIAKQKDEEGMKRYAELAVEYCIEKDAIDALNLLEKYWKVDYSKKQAFTYMLWGKLHESNGRIGQAIECYRNSGTNEGRERANMLNRRR